MVTKLLIQVVITTAGFLHTYDTGLDPADPKAVLPEISLFLPNCTLGPAAEPTANKHKFYVRQTLCCQSDATH